MKLIVYLLLILLFSACDFGGKKPTEKETHKNESSLFLEDSLKSKNGIELRLIRNEIFAKYGYKFKSEDLKEYFSKQSWYKPKYENVDSLLTKIDIENITLIVKLEKILKNYKDTNSLENLYKCQFGLKDHSQPYCIYDWDKNGIVDTFGICVCSEEIIAIVNGVENKIYAKTTRFTSFETDFAVNMSCSEFNMFLFCDMSSGESLLFLKEHEPFLESVRAFELENNTPKDKWSIAGEKVIVTDYSEDGNVNIITKESQGTPGSTADYDFIIYPLYSVYTYHGGKIIIDEPLTEKYNLVYNERFEETIGMTRPVFARPKKNANGKGFYLILEYDEIK